jgi:DNA-binding LacI/PurR family transcriptional regulator
VVGFDDIETAQTSDPPLTTIRQPFHEIGQKAVALLGDLLRDPTITKRRCLIAPSLVTRSSAVSPLRVGAPCQERWT